MHLLKVIFLLLLCLLVMRLASWVIGRLLRVVPRCTPKAASIIANFLCVAALTTWLFVDLEPGEPIDPKAIVFGAIVFAAFAFIDLRLLRTRRPEEPKESTSSAGA